MAISKRRMVQALAAVLVLAGGILGMLLIMAGRQDVEKRIPETPLPMVQAVDFQMEPIEIMVRGEGNVRPQHEVRLIPQVAGKIVDISSNFAGGGVFAEGERLVQVESIDYELAVTLAEAMVRDSESRFQLAQEEAEAAREEWQMLRNDSAQLPAEMPPLVARKPQLAAARAKLEADRSELKRTKLNLERTGIRAPFAGRVSEKFVDRGQYVTPGQVLATIYSIDSAEVLVPVADAELQWFRVPGFTVNDSTGSPATVTSEVAGQRMQRQGVVLRSEGKIDPLTRMVNLVIQVDAPFADHPPLVPGLFVSVDIRGRVIENAARIPREALRQGDMVWVVDQGGAIRFRSVDVARKDDRHVIVRSGLQETDRIVMTNLKAISEGMKVRVAESQGRAGS